MRGEMELRDGDGVLLSSGKFAGTMYCKRAIQSWLKLPCGEGAYITIRFQDKQFKESELAELVKPQPIQRPPAIYKSNYDQQSYYERKILPDKVS